MVNACSGLPRGPASAAAQHALKAWGWRRAGNSAAGDAVGDHRRAAGQQSEFFLRQPGDALHRHHTHPVARVASGQRGALQFRQRLVRPSPSPFTLIPAPSPPPLLAHACLERSDSCLALSVRFPVFPAAPTPSEAVDGELCGRHAPADIPHDERSSAPADRRRGFAPVATQGCGR